MSVFLAPDPIQSTQFIPGGNTPASGGQLFFYTAGSSTKQTVYKDSAGAVPHTNPIILDSGGNIPSGGEVWFTGGVTYKVIFAPSTDSDPPVSPYWTKDNLSGMNDTSVSQNEWVSGPAPTFVSATAFSLAGDQTANFTVGRRLKTTNTGGIVYCTIVSASFSGVTTVNVTTDSGSLDAGLSAVSYGLLEPSNRSIDDYHIYRKGTAIASAGNSTTNIWQSVGDYVHITGTNSIRSFSSAPYAGSERTLIFDGALTVFSSASMVLPGNANISTSANDRMSVRAETVSTYIVTMYQPAAGFLSLSVQSSSTVFAGPSSGAAALPQFRTLVGAESALQLLSVTTCVSTASVTFSLSTTNPFDEYEIHAYNVVPTANNNTLLMRISEDNGASFVSAANYTYCINGAAANISSATQYTVTASGGNTSILVSDSGNLSNAVAGRQYCAVIKAYQPAATANIKAFETRGNNVAGAVSIWGGGTYTSTNSNVTAIQLLMNTGSISTGTFNLYGIRKT